MKNSPPWLKERENSQLTYKNGSQSAVFACENSGMGDLLQSPFITITIICRIRENQMVYEFNFHKLGCLVEILC